ncbi:MAG: DHHW family protein [Vulcanibacillus sp.]
MKKYWLATFSALLLITVIATSYWATDMINKVEERQVSLEKMNPVSDEPILNADDKIIEDKLTANPNSITEEYLYFDDRVLERYHYDENHILKSSEILSSAMNNLPEDINKYLMLVPMPISLESDEVRQYSDDLVGTIEEIYAKMPSDVVTLDVAGGLVEHKDEYIYFRTDHVWTALGAYYAADKFCQSAGIEIIGIEEYRMNRLDNYIGTMGILPNTESLWNNPDHVNYYILNDAANEQIITSRRSKSEYITYKSPMVAVSRGGYDTFIGAYYSHSILKGDATNGKTLMILGDQYSKAFTPWLTPYYTNIVLVSPSLFNGSSEEFWHLFTEYQITDFLIIEYGRYLGDSVMNKRIIELMSSAE